MIAIIGANGQLGIELGKLWPEALKIDREVLDISNSQAVANFDWKEVDVIVNAAAYTNVEKAETEEGQLEAWSVNATGVANLAMLAHKKKMILVHVSTDYVFKDQTCEYKEEAELGPINYYGVSKAAGEAPFGWVDGYLIRTSWLVGEGKNFVRTMLGVGQKGIDPKVVDDQFGRPTFAKDLAQFIDYLFKNKCDFGKYNFSNSGRVVSWAELTEKVFEVAGYKNKVLKVDTNTYNADKPNAVKRPKNSAFNLTKVNSSGFIVRDWETALTEYVRKELL